MATQGFDFTLEPPFDYIAQNLLNDLGTPEEIKKIPYEVMFKVLSHPDDTRFVSPKKPSVRLNGIVGPFTVYDELRSFLYTVNLHTGYFGDTLPEVDYLRKVPAFSVLFVSYVDADGVLRDIQIIKRGD